MEKVEYFNYLSIAGINLREEPRNETKLKFCSTMALPILK
jgi:hypothetical protein